LAPRREHVEDRVQNLANVDLAPPAAALGRWGTPAKMRAPPEKESQPIPTTQQLSGSALRYDRDWQLDIRGKRAIRDDQGILARRRVAQPYYALS
jgi:hypothetical protein